MEILTATIFQVRYMYTKDVYLVVSGEGDKPIDQLEKHIGTPGNHVYFVDRFRIVDKPVGVYPLNIRLKDGDLVHIASRPIGEKK